MFPYGKGGPTTFNIFLPKWLKHFLVVHDSRFPKNIDFIFFTRAVIRRKRLSTLSLLTPLRSKTTNAILSVLSLLDKQGSEAKVAEEIDSMMRSGCLSASFHTVRGSSAFWAKMKRLSWAYLTVFVPCQIFITMSPANLFDPYVFMQINRDMMFQQVAGSLCKKRTSLLAANPFAASTIFHRRVEFLVKEFLL